MLLEEMKWEGPETLDLLVVWGLEPLKFLLDQFCEYCVSLDDDSGYLGYHDVFVEKVLRLENTLYRLTQEMNAQALPPENEVKEAPANPAADEFNDRYMQLAIQILSFDYDQRVLVHKDLIKLIKKAKALKPEEIEE